MFTVSRHLIESVSASTATPVHHDDRGGLGVVIAAAFLLVLIVISECRRAGGCCRGATAANSADSIELPEMFLHGLPPGAAEPSLVFRYCMRRASFAVTRPQD